MNRIRKELPRRHWALRMTWLLALAALLLSLVLSPVYAAGAAPRQAQQADATTVNANIYIATSTLQPLFQQQIDQQAPGAFNSAINSLVGNLPNSEQGWARQMANALLQPTVTLTGLRPQNGGLATNLRVSLYQGDPHPLTSSLLVSFSVLNSSTLQVNARGLNGQPGLVNGPLTTLQVPIGKLNHVTTTPNCGDAALALNLQYPISLSVGQTTPPNGGAQAAIQPQMQPLSLTRPASSTNVSAYVELPNASLAAMGSSIGSMPINGSLTAKNIRVSTKGANLQIISDIDLGFFRLGVATTTLAPTAINGNLAVHVLSTNLTVFQFFTFPYNSYNQQMERLLNAKLNGALAGKFHVTQAAVGPNSHAPCVAPDSLLLTGTTNIG